MPERARQAIEEELAPGLELDPVRAAAGVIEIINVNMMGAVRVISVEQGEDPRDFTLVAFGGAGPLHAADIARSMGIRKVLVPPRPGLLSALGLLHADVRGDFSLTRLTVAGARKPRRRSTPASRSCATRGARVAAGRGRQERPRAVRLARRYALRRARTSSSPSSWPAAGSMRERWRASSTRFHAPARDVLRLRHARPAGRDRQPAPGGDGRAARSGRRNPRSSRAERCAMRCSRSAPCGFRRRGFVATPVYDRDRLPANCRLTGPAIIEQMDTTTVVPPRARLRNDRFGYLHMAVEPLPATGVVKESARNRPASRRVDPIRAEVVARYLLATAEEMAATLMRTAFSPNIKERADCSTAVFDRHGARSSRSRIACRCISARWSAPWTRSGSAFARATSAPATCSWRTIRTTAAARTCRTSRHRAGVRRRAGSSRSSPTSRTTRTWAAWCPAPKPRCASRSSRKASAFRRCAS